MPRAPYSYLAALLLLVSYASHWGARAGCARPTMCERTRAYVAALSTSQSRWAGRSRFVQPHAQAAVLPYYHNIFRNTQAQLHCIVLVLHRIQVSRGREQIYGLQNGNKSRGSLPTRTLSEHSKDVRIAQFNVRRIVPYPRQYCTLSHKMSSSRNRAEVAQREEDSP